MSSNADCCDCFITFCLCCSLCSRDTQTNCCAQALVSIFPERWTKSLRMEDTSQATRMAQERDREAALWQGDVELAPRNSQPARKEGMNGAAPPPAERNIRDKTMIFGDD
ncbi:hypothetical protein MKEN_00505100 [Mycena kentingensis (nom. inval.)]|nr:hypothetical protein MKEN_00505100 [Mycena kentingensis (nom. inval.)]